MPKIKEVFKWVNWVEERIYPSSRRLPATYQEVEYIQSSGNAYINSWYTPNTSPYFQLQFKWQQVSNIQNNDYIYWAGVSSNNWVTLENTNWFYWNAWWTTWILNHQVSIWTDFEYDIKYNNWTFSVSWTQTWTTTYSVWNWLWTWEFQFFWSGAHNRYMNAKIYYFKMYSWQNFDLIRNFVPCYRKSDWVIWMYDLVWWQFYTNSWGGSFTKWNDV